MRRLRRVLIGVALLVGLLPPAARVLAADEVVLDDSSRGVEVVGNWTTTTTSGGFYGDGYRFHVAGDGGNRVRWAFPQGTAAGAYEVFARWTSGPNRASNATYVVKHSGGSSSISVDQRQNGAVWRTLGTFSFGADGDQGVTLSDKADGVVAADAIRWVPTNTSPTSAVTTTSPTTPSTPATTPGTAATTPSTAATSPGAAGTSSGAAGTAPSTAGTTPSTGATTPSTGATTPSTAATAPSTAATTPSTAATAPSTAVTTPSTGATAPSTSATTPSTSSTTPSTAGTTPSAASANSASGDERFFDQTQFRVDRDAFWDFFSRRGGVRTFGFPVSREFVQTGCSVQIFQRVAMQQCGDAGVGTLNLLQDGILSATRFGASTVPAPDPALIAAAPLPNDPDYASKAIEFVRANAPDSLDGEPVGFLRTYLSTVTVDDAFPQGGDAGLVPLLNLQLWGLPTSKPALDPNNHEFIYQRFQRGVMHYDRGCTCTLGLLVGDAYKAQLVGEGRFAEAFGKQTPTANATQPAPSTSATQPAPSTTVSPRPADTSPTQVSSPDYGMSLFLWGHTNTTERDLKLVTDAGFRWQKTLFQWRQIEGACKGCFDWSESDRVVKASTQAGVHIIARLDFQPPWARADGASNGPPDNYQDYADFVSAFVSRYSAGSAIGRVQAIEIWNEVNLDREWGGQAINPRQAADYVRLLGLAYGAAKAADPSVIVVTAGLSPTGVTDGHAADDVTYMQWLYDAGMRGKYDVLGAHGNTQAPEVDAAFGSLPNFPHASFYFRRIEQLRDVMVKNGDTDKQVWLLEFGWTSDTIHPNYSWFAVTEAKKSANILKAFDYARQNWRPWIGVMTLWTVPDPTWTNDREEYWWAITNADGTARQAYADLVRAKLTGALPGPG